MTLYEKRLAEDIERIRDKIRDIAERVCSALGTAAEAIAENDRESLNRVVMDDYGINRDIRCIDQRCHEFVARHLPAARHLRFISAVLRMTVALERAGDYAVTISRVALQLSKPLPERAIKRIRSMCDISTAMLGDAVEAFLNGDVKLAEETKKLDYRVDRAHDEGFDMLMDEAEDRDPRELVSLLRIYGKIERFSDQAKNICEEAVFYATGELKGPKVFRILFLDEANDLASQLAEAIARKAFPEAGIFSSAGLAPARELHPKLARAGERYGFDPSRARPKPVASLDVFPAPYHLVVAINIDDESRLPRIPYHTILRKWDIDVEVDDCEELIHELSNRIDMMIEKLRGANED